MPRRLPPAPLALALAWALVTGCSQYPDDFTGICPRIRRLRIEEITATGAAVIWETDQAAATYLEIRGGGQPARVIRTRQRGFDHRVELTSLLPGESYRVAIRSDIGFEPEDDDDTLEEYPPSLCASEADREFETRRQPAVPDPTGSPVTDPDDPIVP